MKKTICLFFSIALLCGLFQTCTSKVEILGSIYGVVTNKATGEPIKSAGVTLNPNGATTVTGSDGCFEFGGLSQGGYAVVIAKTDYKEYTSGMITVETGQTTHVDVQLEKLPPSLRVVNNDNEDIDVLDFGAQKSDISRSFNIFNDGESSLEWEITYTADWIKSVSKTSGILRADSTQALVVIIDREKLSGGENTTTFHITSNNGSKQLMIKAYGDTKPVLNMIDVLNITKTTADFSGEVLSAGDPAYTERGFVYSSTSMPTLETTKAKITSSMNSNSQYSSSVTGLKEGDTYYVRAYAINSVGVSYSSNEVKFSTIAQSVSLTTDEVTNIDVINGSAVLNATMTNVGEPRFTERGFYYGLNPEPSMNDNVIRDAGTTTGKYSATITNLQSSSTYYVRAYAIQNDKHVYGETVVFSILNEPSKVTTSNATSISSMGAILNGYVAQVGNPGYTEKGFCYAKNPNPTITTNKRVVSGTGKGDYSCSLTDLEYQTTYYYRAYVIQNNTPIYGNVVSFTTSWQEASVLTLEPTIDAEKKSAKFKGQVINAGDPKYNIRGFCYSTSGYPTIDDKKVEELSSMTGIYTMDVSNLNAGETYYVRAFVRQGDNVVYGDVKTFSIAIREDPMVTTNNVTNIRGIDSGLGTYYDYSVQFNGTISDQGDPAYYERGFVYGTSSSITASSGTKISVSGTGLGKFSTTTTLNVWTASKWYVRAYARTKNGYVYGDAVIFYLQ